MSDSKLSSEYRNRHHRSQEHAMTTPQTTQDYLDWFAEREGWKKSLVAQWFNSNPQHPSGPILSTQDRHPLPATLDTAAMLFEKYLPGWTWERTKGRWEATLTRPGANSLAPEINERTGIAVPITGNTREAELHDRLALVYKALNAKEGT